MNKTLIFLLLVTAPCLALAQANQPNTSISGVLVDKATQKPIELAHIRIKGTSQGTTSNTNGFFKLWIPNNLDSRLVEITCIGYTKVLINAEQLTKKQVIKMKPASIILPELIIDSPTTYETNPKKIISKALALLDSNFYITPVLYQGFYRQLHEFYPQVVSIDSTRKNSYKNYKQQSDFNNLTYLRMIEAQVNILDYGFLDTRQLVNITQLRRSMDKRTYSRTTYEGKGRKSRPVESVANTDEMDSVIIREAKMYALDKFLTIDPIRNYTKQAEAQRERFLLSGNYGYLNNEFLKRHKFKLQEITVYDEEEVYYIKILPANKSYKHGYFSKHQYIPIGKLYIRVSDFAILQMEYSYIINPKKKNFAAWALSTLDGGSTLYHDIIKYRNYNGKMYLSYLKRWQRDADARTGILNDSIQKGYHYLSRELMITQVIADEKGVDDWETAFKVNSNLYQPYVYKPEVWSQSTMMQLTPAEKEKIKQDLEKGANPLGKQFELEGKPKTKE